MWDKMNEDEFTDYLIQLCIEESFNAQFVVVTDLSGQMLTFDGVTLERCSLHG